MISGEPMTDITGASSLTIRRLTINPIPPAGKEEKMDNDLMTKLAKKTKEIAAEQNLIEYGDNLNYGIGLCHMEQAIDAIGIDRGSYNKCLTLGYVRQMAQEMEE